MIQDPNTQTSNPNNGIIELVSEQDLHAITGGGGESPPPPKKARIEGQAHATTSTAAHATTQDHNPAICEDCIHLASVQHAITLDTAQNRTIDGRTAHSLFGL